MMLPSWSVGAATAELAKTCATCGGQYPQDALFCPADGTPLRRISGTEVPTEVDPYLKCEIAGHIEIRQLAGIGAMGRVYRAFQRGIDRDVAVKILHRELSSNQQLVGRFTREAKVASKLQHPNVVSVLLTGQMPDSALYIVMEYLDGLSLMSALAAAGGALPLARALHIAIQLADAVGEAHSQGIVHRDLKPENVMLVRRGEDKDFVKVLDFGIARVHWGEASMATAAGLIFGTARYISPEGARGEAVTEASDVYSIATLAYQMIAGRTPFEGDQAVGLLVQQIHDKPPHLKSLTRASYVPDAIAEVIMAGLAKDPAEREKDARSFGRALVDAARASGLSSDEISRPILMGRNSKVSLPSMERTKQHELSADVRERMGSNPGSPSEPRVTPEPARASNGGGSVGAAGNATVKWTPPPNIAAQLAPIPTAAPSSPRGGRASAPSIETHDRGPEQTPAPFTPTAAGSAPSLDATLDDGTPPPSFPPPDAASQGRLSTPAPAPRTDYAAPAPDAMIPTPAPSDQSMPRQAGGRATYPSKPPSNVDSTLSDAEMARRGKARALLLVFLCFVLGAGVATIVAYRMGRIGPDAGHEELVSLVQSALSANRLVDPPGDNVRDLSATGMKKWPDDSRFVTFRKRASEELTARAIASHATGDAKEANRLIKLAVELDGESVSAKKLSSDWENEPPQHADDVVMSTGAKPLPIAQKPTTAGGGTTGASGAKLAFDVSNQKPRVGAAVDFTARITGAKKVEDAKVTIISASMPAGTSIVATEDGGSYHAGFTFLEAGRFEVVFTAKADGNLVKTTRLVVAGDVPATPQPPQTAAPQPSAAPTPSGTVKWM